MTQTITFVIGVTLGGILGFLVGSVLTHDAITKHKNNERCVNNEK